jgi:putative transposase
MHKAFKYRVYPTKEQEKILNEWQGQLRFVWNQFLSSNIKKYELEKKFIFKYDLKKTLPSMKKEHIWISAPSQSLQEMAFRMDSALRNCYKRKLGFPKFKKKSGIPQGIKIPQQVGQIKTGIKFIKIPKLGEIKWIRHREPQGILKSVTITRDVDQWYVSCLCDIDFVPVLKEVKSIENDITGIDLGIKNFLVDSNGVVIDSPKFLKKSEKKLKSKQKSYSKKKKDSNNQHKTRILLARQYRKVRFQRKDFLHKLSSQIANENSVIICEDLAVKNMTKNHKLAKAISDQGWSQFITYLSYKMNWCGGQLIKIDRFAPSSQICSSCGSKQKISLDMRTYVCNCGLVLDRDYNASLNIKEFGLRKYREGLSRIYACGDTSNKKSDISDFGCVSMKQEAPSFSCGV